MKDPQTTTKYLVRLIIEERQVDDQGEAWDTEELDYEELTGHLDTYDDALSEFNLIFNILAKHGSEEQGS